MVSIKLVSMRIRHKNRDFHLNKCEGANLTNSMRIVVLNIPKKVQVAPSIYQSI